MLDAKTGAVSGTPESSFENGTVLSIVRSDPSSGVSELFEIPLVGMDAAPTKLAYVDALFDESKSKSPIENTVSMVKGSAMKLEPVV